MRCATTFPHIEIIILISLTWITSANAIYGAVDLGDSCFSMSSMSSVLWVRLDTGDVADENATVVTADGHSCILPNRKIVKGSWGAEVVFEVTPDWQCHLPGDDIEFKAKKGGGFISCHKEMQDAEAEVEVMVSYYNHVVATHAALFTTTVPTSSTSTTTVQPNTVQVSIPLTTPSSVIESANVTEYESNNDESKKNKSSINRKHINFQINEDVLHDRKKKTNKHPRRKSKSNKRKGKIETDILIEENDSLDYSNVTPDASLFTNTRRHRLHSHTTEKTSSWQFDSANPYQDDHFFSDSADNMNWDREEKIEDNNMEPPSIAILPSTNKEASQDLSLFQFKEGMSLSVNEYIIIGAGSIIGIALLISAIILIKILKGKRRQEPVDYWV